MTGTGARWSRQIACAVARDAVMLSSSEPARIASIQTRSAPA